LQFVFNFYVSASHSNEKKNLSNNFINNRDKGDLRADHETFTGENYLTKVDLCICNIFDFYLIGIVYIENMNT